VWVPGEQRQRQRFGAEPGEQREQGQRGRIVGGQLIEGDRPHRRRRVLGDQAEIRVHTHPGFGERRRGDIDGRRRVLE
jgi:hypothetical protein